MKQKFCIIAIAIISLLLTSCGSESSKNSKVAKLSVISGNNQTVKVNEESKLIKIEFMGETIKGVMGGKGEATPVIGAKAIIEVPKGVQLVAGERAMTTEESGCIFFRVKASTFGDHYITISSAENPSKKTSVRFTSGITIEGAKQEIYSGDTSEPFGIKITDAQGKPVANLPIYFELTSTPSAKAKASLSTTSVITNSDGIASTTLKTDSSATGNYIIKAEIAPNNLGFESRTIEINQLAINRSGMVITVIAGLALFIFGMNQMSNGLQQVAGNKLKTILGYFARNRFVAVLTGTLVTGFIQSSSACTVMVVGFVNAGLLSLQQAIGVIFGANIGTTVTAQMLSFKLDGLAFPAIILGVFGLLIAKKSTTKGWVSVIFGFGLLFYGMGIMGDELKGLAKFPTFIEFFKSFDCTPVNGHMPIASVLGAIAIGTLMTVLIQSSSATIGITIALSASGLINFYTAMPLILGDNIGTTITAILASIGGNRRSLQAAVAHTMFNLIGACYMTLLFYINWNGQPIYLELINNITAGDVFAAEPENIARHVAMGHTLFNIFNVLIMLPFIGLFVKICNKLIPINEEQQKSVELEPHLLKTPSLALQQVVSEISNMTKLSWEMVEKSLNMVSTGNFEEEKSLAESEECIDKKQEDVNAYLSKLTKAASLTTTQSRAVPILVHCNNNAERLGDNAEDIQHLAKRIYDGNSLSPEMIEQINTLKGLIEGKVSMLFNSIKNVETISPEELIKNRILFQSKLSEIENHDLESLRQGKEDVISGVIFIEIITILGRINSRINNLLERTQELIKMHVIVKF